MIILSICLLVLILFVTNSELVISGASYGLMLWYKNVLPILLPFMLISGIIVRQINIYSRPNKNNSCAIFTNIFLGVFCGYPIGAKTCNDFIQNNSMDKITGNILLPLCNNSSPMFISGYIMYRILNNSISFFHIIFLIYFPYIIVTIFSFLVVKIFTLTKNTNVNKDNKAAVTKTELTINQYIINTVNQITLVGIYIMICSIIIEFIIHSPHINPPYSQFLSGIIEITRGTFDISNLAIADSKKIALIIALTSFGGVSSILQTQMVIQKSGLSIIYYTVMKALCAFLTYILCILFI